MSTDAKFASVSEFMDTLRQQAFDFHRSPAEACPAVSIISSFYNVSREYFLETNRSIQNQTFQNYEWIVADDCSTDEKAIALFGELPQLNSKIVALKRETNGGLAAGRNTAIEKARGRYLFFMDTDDILAPTMIEKCVLFLETHPDFSFVNTYSVGFQDQTYWWNKGFDKISEFIHENRVTGRLLYRKTDFDKGGAFDESLRFYEDWERWLRAIAQGQKGWTIPEYLDCYRRTQSGLLATSRSKAQEEQDVTKTIRAKYQTFFDTHTLLDTVVERPMFDLSVLRQKIDVKNSINSESESKRILCWFPHLEVGGADKFNLDLLSGLKQRGYRITIVTTVPAQHRWFAEFYKITPDIFHLPRLLHYGHWLSFARYIIESRHIDICLLSNAYYAYYLLPFLREDFPNVAFVDYTHTEDPDWRAGGYPRVSCQFSEFLDRHIVTSNNLANHFIELNENVTSKIKVCYINVDEQLWQRDLEMRSQLRKRLSYQADDLVVLFPARTTAQKRPSFFIDIINDLVKKGFAIKALMLGSGELLEAVNEKIAEYGLAERVKILPFVSSEEMKSYYSAADVVLLPSAYEGISLVMYEAMAMSLPVVASAVGGQRELMAPGTGVLLPLGEGDAAERSRYVEALEPLLRSQPERAAIGEAARRRIESYFCLDTMIDRMEAFFEEAKQHRVRSHEQPKVMFTAEEMLLWVQEFLALDSIWHEHQRLQDSLSKSEEWARTLESERNLYQAQSNAWKRVAQKNQMAINAQSSAEKSRTAIGGVYGS